MFLSFCIGGKLILRRHAYHTPSIVTSFVSTCEDYSGVPSEAVYFRTRTHNTTPDSRAPIGEQPHQHDSLVQEVTKHHTASTGAEGLCYHPTLLKQGVRRDDDASKHSASELSVWSMHDEKSLFVMYGQSEGAGLHQHHLQRSESVPSERRAERYWQHGRFLAGQRDNYNSPRPKLALHHEGCSQEMIQYAESSVPKWSPHVHSCRRENVSNHDSPRENCHRSLHQQQIPETDCAYINSSSSAPLAMLADEYGRPCSRACSCISETISSLEFGGKCVHQNRASINDCPLQSVWNDTDEAAKSVSTTQTSYQQPVQCQHQEGSRSQRQVLPTVNENSAHREKFTGQTSPKYVVFCEP